MSDSPFSRREREILVKYCSDIHEGVRHRGDEGCGKHCLLFGIEIGYYHPELSEREIWVESGKMEDCEWFDEGYEIGQELSESTEPRSKRFQRKMTTIIRRLKNAIRS